MRQLEGHPFEGLPGTPPGFPALSSRRLLGEVEAAERALEVEVRGAGVLENPVETWRQG